jgi:protoheme IX farnesyltransferase
MPVLLFAIIFFWTPPHFWALALYKAGEYAKVGVPMLPVVAGEAETRRQIVIYSLILVPLTLVPWGLGLVSLIYGAPAAVLGLAFIAGALRVAREKSEAAARALFAFSILYLFLLFALVIADALVGPWVRGLG